jgi:hypothetical protein
VGKIRNYLPFWWEICVVSQKNLNIQSIGWTGQVKNIWKLGGVLCIFS